MVLTPDIVLAFFLASVLLGLAPGPDNIFVLTQSTLHGRSAGLMVTLGLCTGLIVHSLAVAFGAAALFQSSELAFSALKLVGAAYLLYLAWGAFRAPPASLSAQSVGAPGRLALYRRGIIMNITNPKVSIFFLAFLPQFADPARGPVALQIVLLGGLFILATLLVFGAVAVAAGQLRGWLLRSQRIQLWINRLAGAVFVGLALRLATTQR
ncbi:LysE family translocator [Halopseudomonas pertucinogena]|uniref:Membrane protein n=1 Tax=Halopseudomonas pertucinogena TaxID=86175 RepID=A0ABQ2CIQ9_9GAMM|nr:LysE family translocator [Halopseudomonas pertucinogena]GGI89178.1 membrane protein [Halopseudomonas pertucinogena]